VADSLNNHTGLCVSSLCAGSLSFKSKSRDVFPERVDPTGARKFPFGLATKCNPDEVASS